MSYDVWITTKTVDGVEIEIDSWNCTSNCGPQWREAGAQIHEWDERRARDVIDELDLAIRTMENDIGKYRAMNPANGWGNADDMLDHFLIPMLRAFRTHPSGVIGVSR